MALTVWTVFRGEMLSFCQVCSLTPSLCTLSTVLVSVYQDMHQFDVLFWLICCSWWSVHPIRKYIWGFKGTIPVFMNPLVAFSTVAAFPYAGPSKLLTCNWVTVFSGWFFIHLVVSCAKYVFNGQKKLKSNGCNRCVQCGGKHIRTTLSTENGLRCYGCVCYVIVLLTFHSIDIAY